MSRRTRSSRLSRYAERQSKKQFLFFGIGTIIIILLLVMFAGNILGLFGNIIFGIKGDGQENPNDTIIEEVLIPPSLDHLPIATSSSQLDISGTTTYTEGRVYLFLNDDEIDSARLDEEGDFMFRKVSLKNGTNNFKAQYRIDEKYSDFSEEIVITRSSEKPLLELTSPSDGTTFKKADKRINVNGKTDPTGSVTVNGFRAVVDSEGNFSYFLELNEGDNKIAVVATSLSGNSEQKEITVKYEN